MLSCQQQVGMQEAVQMVDNQQLMVCSDRITYVRVAQGQALQSETAKSQKKDLITVYRNRNEKHNHLLLEHYFYRFSLIQHSTIRERKTLIQTNTRS